MKVQWQVTMRKSESATALKSLSAVLDDRNDPIPRQANNLINVAAHTRSVSPDTCLDGNRQASVLRKVGQG